MSIRIFFKHIPLYWRCYIKLCSIRFNTSTILIVTHPKLKKLNMLLHNYKILLFIILSLIIDNAYAEFESDNYIILYTLTAQLILF